MAAVTKIQSNKTGLRFSEELSPKEADPSAVWKQLEPNSYADFGGQTTLVARTPITDGRQRKKGVIVDLDASGGFNTDVTLKNLEDIGQGFFFADLRRKGEGVISAIDGATEKYELDHAMGMYVGSLVFASGNAIEANNGLKRITAVNSVFATGALTLAGNAANNETVTIGTTTYTFKTALTSPEAEFEVLIGATASDSIDNLVAAITAGAGAGTLYGSDTDAHELVTAAAGAGDTMDVTALLDGPSGNSIATTETLATGGSQFGAATLTGGDADVTVAENLTTETPPAGATLVVVGFQFATSDATIAAPGGGVLPSLSMTAKVATELGLIPGEYVFIGGDAAITQFATAADQGFCRVRAVAVGATDTVSFDKTPATFVTDAGTGKTIQIFFGRVLKNEVGTLIVERTYQIERTLGAPDTDDPADLQAEYLEGAYANEMAITAGIAAKLEADLSFVAMDHTTTSASEGLKAGTRPLLDEADALNTSNDISRIKLAVVVPGDAAPTPLFAFAEQLDITINNGVTPEKALGVLGAIGVGLGDFAVSGTITAYFADVASIEAVRENEDITLEVHYVKANSGITMDLPLIALGDGRLNIEKDRAIKIPLSMEAATGALIDEDLNHTALFVFWDYLPSLADA